MSPETDIIVAGAGIVGLSAAMLAILRWPQCRIIVLERSRIGSGASRFGGASDVPFTPDERHRELVWRSTRVRRDYPQLPEVSRRVPTIWISKASPERLSERLGGAKVTPFDHTEGALPIRLHPGERAWRAGEGRFGCPNLACQTLARRLRASGRVRIFEATRVEAIERCDVGLRIFTARAAISATGAWAVSQSWAGPHKGVRLKRIVAVHLETKALHRLQIQYDHEDLYFLPDPRQPGRSILCLSSPERAQGTNPDTFSLTRDDRALALAALAKHAPELVNNLAGGRVFCDAYNEECAPEITVSAELPGLFLAGVCSGSGFRHAPAIADHALDLVARYLLHAHAA
ncbi:MAG: FAD-dependent oxidoreductase [Hyphomicrobiales bacterium]